MTRFRRRLLALATGAALLSGCVSSSAYRAGERAEQREDYNRAVLEYSRAVKHAPENLTYRKSLERARIRAAEEHANAGRRLAARGLLKEAVEEMQLALDLTPSSTTIAAELADLRARSQAGATAGVPRSPAKKPQSALPGLDLPPSAQEPLGLSFHGASLRDTYLALGRAVGVNFIFDPQFQDTQVNLDLRSVRFPDALRALASVGRTFHTVVGSKIVTVVPDTPAKRKEYEQQVVKTIFLSNADPKQAVDLLRVVLGARRVAPVLDSNAITITDAPDKVAAAEHVLGIIDKRRAEVVVEVELLEVNRNRLRDYGLEITSSLVGGGGVAGAAFPASERIERDEFGRVTRIPLTLDDNPYDAGNILISSLPGVIYRLLKNDTSTRLLANPRLRTSEGQTAQARFGDQIPVPVTTFTPISTGSINQQPITSFEYKSVGVNIDVTPRVHDGGEVSLELKLDISSLAPSLDVAGIQGLPTFNSRTISSKLRLRAGETTVLAGLISDTERKTMTGIPGLSDLPFLGKLLSRNRREVQQTDIIMTLRPHIVSQPEITEEDLRSFALASDTPPLLFEVPPGSAATSPAADPRRPPADAQRPEPIRPPPATPTPLVTR